MAENLSKGDIDMNREPELVFYCNSTLLEGPRWDAKRNSLLCVSIEQSCIYEINTKTGKIRTFQTNGQVGCALLDNNDHIIAAAYNGLYQIDMNTGKSEFLIQLNTEKDLRYNDGILDAKGRVLVGTTGYNCSAPNRNCLYSWDGQQIKKLVTGTTISNGIAFSKDNTKMYFVDTPTKKVGCYSYDIETGDSVFEKYVIEITDGGVPDGICMDDDGMLWTAEWGGSKVSKWNPATGEKTDEIVLPCLNVSSCCIGGEKKDTLFITTAKHDDGSMSEIMAGGLFAVKIR